MCTCMCNTYSTSTSTYSHERHLLSHSFLNEKQIFSYPKIIEDDDAMECTTVRSSKWLLCLNTLQVISSSAIFLGIVVLEERLLFLPPLTNREENNKE